MSDLLETLRAEPWPIQRDTPDPHATLAGFVTLLCISLLGVTAALLVFGWAP